MGAGHLDEIRSIADPCEDEDVPFGVRRLVILAVVGLLAGGIFGFLRARSTSDSSAPNVPVAFLDGVLPGLCTMEAQLAAGQRGEASNTFWNDVHLPAHALAAELVEVDRTKAAVFQRSKLAVETDLATLAPGLVRSVSSFERVARSALVSVGRPQGTPCA